MTPPSRRLSRRSLLASVGALSLAGALGRRGARARGRAAREELVPALLDGVWLWPDEAWRNELLPIAVMIDNFPDGRPQLGMDTADLVYEALVEGGITRFMAVYLRREAEWIEPVRSARTPFLYPVRELNGVLAHVGAASVNSPADADSQFGQWGVLHLDEQYDPGPFWRDRNRYAPHNACTSTVDLRAYAAGYGWEGPSALEPWLFKEDFEAVNRPARPAAVASYAFFWGQPAGSMFAADWYYDPAANLYLRSMAGRPHRDGLSGERLTAKNVIVHGDSAGVVDGDGHVLYGSLGEGPAYVFLDGQVIDATWVKPTREARTRYYDLAGEEIRFNRGSTWVALLPYGSPFEFA